MGLSVFFLSVGSAHAAATLTASATEGGPSSGQQGVPVDARIDRAFLGDGNATNIVLSGATVTTSTVLLQTNVGNAQAGGGTGANLCVTVGIEWNRMVVCNHASLTAETWYTLTFTGALATNNPDSQTLAARTVYVFQAGGFEGGMEFLPPPFITGSVPRPGAVVPINAKLRVYFNAGGTGGTTMQTSGQYSVLNPDNVFLFEVVDGEPQNDNLLSCADTANCNMSWNQTGSQLIVTPGKKAPAGTVSYNAPGVLVAGSKYLFLIEGGGGGPSGAPGVRNTSGIGLMGPPLFIVFTATGADVVGPDVQATYPANAATTVDRATYDISIGFSEAIDPTTVTGSSILLYKEASGAGFDAGDDTLVTGTSVSYTSRDNTAHLSPSVLLDASSTYYTVVTTNIKDLAGNALVAQRVKSFATGTKTNGADTDDTAPQITALNADNFSVSITFSEPMKFHAAVNGAKRSSTGANMVNNVANWRLLMLPQGYTFDLAKTGRTITYDAPKRTLVFGGLMLPPNQQFAIQAKTSSGYVRVSDLTGNYLSPPMGTGSVKSMDETMGMTGGDEGDFNFHQNGLRPKMVMPMSPTAGATTNVEAVIAITKAVPLGGSITLTFPTGYSTAATCSTAPTVPVNNDINGPSTGTVGIASITCNNIDRSVQIVTNGAATQATDVLEFVLQGIINTPVPTATGTEGYRVDIKTKTSTGVVLESLTSMPFMIKEGGSRSIAGYVFKDNGAGGGDANDQIKNGSEPGVRGVKVCMHGPMGQNCATTSATGAYLFNSLSDGFYNITLPPIASGALFVNGSTFRDVRLSGSNSTGVDFGLTTTTQTINVSITGIPADTNLDVFTFNPNSNNAGNIVREVDYSAATASVSLPVSAGTWKVGIGPRMNKDPSMGGGGAPPVFTFMPPQPKDIFVPAGTGATVVFNLLSAEQQIKGRVVSASGSGIANAFVMARPASLSNDMGKEGMAQTKQDGTFVIYVSTGSYAVQAFMPGMPPSSSIPVLVKANSVGADGNTSADVYQNGTLVTGAAPLSLTILQGGLSIAGSVLDASGNPIPYAHVQAKKQTSGSFNGIFRDAPSNSAGAYTLYVEAGTWDITAFVPGYGQLPSTTVVISTNSVTGQNLQVSSSSFATINGTVTQGGTGVGGVHVNAFSANGGNSTVSGTDGTYSLKVPAGTYTVDGYLPGSGPTSVVTGQTVTGAQTLDNIDLTIGAVGTIFVAIPNITDAFVRAEDSSGKGNGTNAATSTGVYTITVSAGTYTVRAQHPSLGLIGSQAVTVTGGATTSVTFSPPTTYAVTGTVSSSNANCILNTSVSFADSTNGRVTMVMTDANGAFSVNLPNGTYRIMAGKPGCIDDAAPSTITVNGAAVSTGTNRMLGAASETISGRVTLDGAGITLSAMVIGRNSDNKYVFAEVSSGTYTLRVSAGDWIVKARSDGYESAESTVAAGATANLTLTTIAGYTRQEPLSTQLTPSAGGMVKNATIGSSFELSIPAGALGNGSNANPVTTTTTTAFVSQTPTALVVGSSVVEVTCKDENGNTKSSLEASATITIPITAADLTAAGVSDITKLSLATWNDSSGTWDSLPTTVDSTNRTLTAPVEHFSLIGPVAPSGGGTSTPAASPSGSPGGTTGGGGGGGGRRSITNLPVTTPTGDAATPAQALTKEMLQSVRNLLKMTLKGKIIVFKDIPIESWFAPYVASVIQSGIASGYKDVKGNLTGEFGPARNITYAEIAKMTLEAANLSPANTLAVPTNRSARNHWAAAYIDILERLGATVYTDQLNVNASASRGAVIQTIVDVLEISAPSAPAPVAPASGSGTTAGSGASLSQSGTTVTGSGSTATVTPAPTVEAPAIVFKDLSQDHIYASAINLLVKIGVISGDTNKDGTSKGTVRPNAPINRAEVSKIFTKLIELQIIQ